MLFLLKYKNNFTFFNNYHFSYYLFFVSVPIINMLISRIIKVPRHELHTRILLISHMYISSPPSLYPHSGPHACTCARARHSALCACLCCLSRIIKSYSRGLSSCRHIAHNTAKGVSQSLSLFLTRSLSLSRLSIDYGCTCITHAW